MKYGGQMFSLRGQLKDEAGYDRCFGLVKNMGAEVVQLSATGGGSISPDVVKRVSDKYELPVCVTHDPWDRLTGDLDALVKEHRTFGCAGLGVGMMPKQYRTGKREDIEAFIKELNAVAAKLKDNGMTVSYHNHWFEFDEIDGKKIYDMLIEGTTDVLFIPDTFWMRVKGQDIEGYLAKLSGRIDTLHLKDYKKSCGLPVFRAVGKGVLDFESILKAAKAAGVKNCVAELDISPNPIKSTEFSMKTIAELRKKIGD